MWFWIFMLVNNLILPVLMLAFGKLFQTKPPKAINSIYGYRTKMSSLNQDTWNYAHLYFGKLWLRMGIGMLALTVLGMLVVYGKDENTVGLFGGIVISIQVLLLFLSIARTEWELRRRFDADGDRK